MSVNPIRRFNTWLNEARALGTDPAEACALATADGQGIPSVRFVLLKGADESGFVFFTHVASRKGKELEHNPKAALAFYWPPDRQVRLEGKVKRVSKAEADAYWNSRPRDHQLAALASRQSEELPERKQLSDAYRRTFKQHDGQPVPRPEGWVGYRVVPDRIEFWVRQEPRLHHRELFLRRRDGWKKVLLQP